MTALVRPPVVLRAGSSALGVAAVVWFLALGAAIPGVGFVVLGYLLAVEGRFARGAPLAASFPLLAAAPRAGAALVVGWLCVLPARLLWAATLDARVVAPGGRASQVLLGLTVAAALLAALHLVGAALRGFSFGALLWPVGNLRWALRGPSLPPLRPVWTELALVEHLWLGVRGFGGALAWLALPALLWVVARAGDSPRPGLVVLGGLALVPVLAWLPFLQARFAVERRWRALFEWRAVRAHFRRAPVAFLLALVLTYALTLPLVLLKVVLPPRDAAWLVTIVFVATVLPVRLALAGAWRRATQRSDDAPRWLTWPVRGVLVAFLCVYAALLFLAPVVDAHGKAALLSHHAFLLPSPF